MMRKSCVVILMFGIVFIPRSGFAQACVVGEGQECFCADNLISIQSCKSDGSGWEPCDCTYYTVWCDDATGLCWQDPQKDAYDLEDPGLVQPDAVRYCEELVLEGYDDWRLPNIDAMRTVISGNPPTETGGECPVTEGSPRDDFENEACFPVISCEGPGVGNCYWIPEFTGTCCDKPDPASVGHPLEFVSSTLASDDPNWAGCVLYDNGAVSFNHINSYADVRCVRDAPAPPVICQDGPLETCVPGETRQCTASNGKTGAQTCADDGLCFGPCESTQFTPSPPITDICDECDQIQLTVKVPERLTVQPAQILAFLYELDDSEWAFPPMRPPDAGTEDNQVINPDIDVDKPFTMTVPACTYYHENCVAGYYYLVVYLLNENKMPPYPTEGEYGWGMIQEPLILGNGPQQVIEKEVMLVQCGEDTNGNGIGDCCETETLCEGNFDGDQDQDGTDAFDFKVDFGRSLLDNPCESSDTCNGDFDCDGDCDGSDAFTFKGDFGRSTLGNPCPTCEQGIDWCLYP